MNMDAAPELNMDIIAVIAAAIAAIEESDSGDLVIRRINRISGFKPAWGESGLRECIDSRKIY